MEQQQQQPQAPQAAGIEARAVLPCCTHLASTNVVVEDISTDDEFASAFAAAFPALKVLAQLPRFCYKPDGARIHSQVSTTQVISLCSSLQVIRIRPIGHSGEQWCGGGLSSLASLTGLTALELYTGWFGSAAGTELGVLTSLKRLQAGTDTAKFMEALPVIKSLPQLQWLIFPASALCKQCFGQQQADMVALAAKCRAGFGIADDGYFGTYGCKHLPGRLKAYTDSFMAAHCKAVAAQKKAAAAATAAAASSASQKKKNEPSEGSGEAAAEEDADWRQEDVWGEYD